LIKDKQLLTSRLKQSEFGYKSHKVQVFVEKKVIAAVAAGKKNKRFCIPASNAFNQLTLRMLCTRLWPTIYHKKKKNNFFFFNNT
jgi:hypothetical protein